MIGSGLSLVVKSGVIVVVTVYIFIQTLMLMTIMFDEYDVHNDDNNDDDDNDDNDDNSDDDNDYDNDYDGNDVMIQNVDDNGHDDTDSIDTSRNSN